MIDIMDSLRAHRDKPLTELEVFSGNILGKKERASTRFIRAANQEVQERFNRDISAIIRSIIHGDDEEYGDGDAEALPRAIACWKVALETKGWENQVMLRSWKYVAAAVCMEQLFRFRAGQLRPL
jgi:branched-subunit amino acid aminotransferase/4-amino-4-deoxychorismate lyase